jgi:hypothetical protein
MNVQKPRKLNLAWLKPKEFYLLEHEIWEAIEDPEMAEVSNLLKRQVV